MTGLRPDRVPSHIITAPGSIFMPWSVGRRRSSSIVITPPIVQLTFASGRSQVTPSFCVIAGGTPAPSTPATRVMRIVHEAQTARSTITSQRVSTTGMGILTFTLAEFLYGLPLTTAPPEATATFGAAEVHLSSSR